MKGYPEYKEAEIRWVNYIPKNWDVKPLFALMSENKESNTGNVVQNVLSLSYGKIIRRDLSNNFGLLPESFETYQIIHPGYIVLRLTDLQNDKKSLRVGLVKEKGIITSAYIGLKSSDTLNSHFVYYLLHTYDLMKVFYGEGAGVRQSMTYKDLRRMPIILPSLSEQQAIADFLERKTAQIDTLIEKKQRQIDLLKEQRTALINHTVTKGLDPDVPMKDSGVEWLGSIPRHWNVKRIKYLGRITGGYSFKSDVFEVFDTGCRVLKIANIQTMRIDWADESFVDESYYHNLPDFRLYNGDLVFALTRPVISTGIKAAIIQSEEKILINQRNAVFRASTKQTVSWMYYVLFNSRFVDYFISLIDTTGQQPNISSIDIGNIPIPLPPEDEIKTIIKFLEEETKGIGEALTSARRQIELIQEYRTALISAAVTGKVDVR